MLPFSLCQTWGVKSLTGATLIATGGWHPTFCQVLLIAETDGHAIVAVDGNDGGAQLEPWMTAARSSALESYPARHELRKGSFHVEVARLGFSQRCEQRAVGIARAQLLHLVTTET